MGRSPVRIILFSMFLLLIKIIVQLIFCCLICRKKISPILRYGTIEHRFATQWHLKDTYISVRFNAGNTAGDTCFKDKAFPQLLTGPFAQGLPAASHPNGSSLKGLSTATYSRSQDLSYFTYHYILFLMLCQQLIAPLGAGMF